MGTTTKNLGMYLPAENDFYQVEKDQNDNFEILDKAIGEIKEDNYKIFTQEIPNGANLNDYKTPGNYNSKSPFNTITNNPFQRGAFTLEVNSIQGNVKSNYCTQIIKNYESNGEMYIRHADGDRGASIWSKWEKITTEVDLKEVSDYQNGLAGNVVGSFPLTRATEGNVYRVPQTKKFHICTENYNGSLISLPNGNFEELSVFSEWKKNISSTGTQLTGGYINMGKAFGKQFRYYCADVILTNSHKLIKAPYISEILGFQVMPYGLDPSKADSYIYTPGTDTLYSKLTLNTNGHLAKVIIWGLG